MTTEFVAKDSSTDCSEFYVSDDISINMITSIQSRPKNLKAGDFILIKFQKKKNVKHYVGTILLKNDDGDYNVSYLRKTPSGTFVFPNVKDEASVHVSDIILQLPMPTVTKDTNRTASLFTFNLDLSSYNL